MTDMLLAWAASASALIVVVLLLRWVAGRRISAGLRYGIWAVVLIRLLVPGSLALSVTIPRLPGNRRRAFGKSAFMSCRLILPL